MGPCFRRNDIGEWFSDTYVQTQQRNGPGISGAIPPVFAAGSSIAGAARPVDNGSPWGPEAFPHQLAPGVAVALVIVPIAIIRVAIARTDPKPEWADLNAGAAAAGTHIELGGS